MSAAYRSAEEDVPVPTARALSNPRGRLLGAASFCATALLWIPVMGLFLGGMFSDEVRAGMFFASFIAWSVAVIVLWSVEEPVKVDPLSSPP